MAKTTELARLKKSPCKCSHQIPWNDSNNFILRGYPKTFRNTKVTITLENALEKQQNDFFTLQDIQSKTKELFQQTKTRQNYCD